MTNRKSLAIGLLATLGFSLAGGPAAAADGVVDAKVSHVMHFEGHSGLLIRVPNMTDLGGCGSTGWFIVPDTHAHYKNMVGMILMARASDLTLQISVSNCHEGYGRVRNVLILP